MSERVRAVLSPVISWIDDGKVRFRRVGQVWEVDYRTPSDPLPPPGPHPYRSQPRKAHRRPSYGPGGRTRTGTRQADGTAARIFRAPASARKNRTAPARRGTKGSRGARIPGSRSLPPRSLRARTSRSSKIRYGVHLNPGAVFAAAGSKATPRKKAVNKNDAPKPRRRAKKDKT